MDAVAMQKYVDLCKDVFDLSHWKVVVSRESCEEDSWAEVEVSDNLWEATIKLAPDFFTQTKLEQRRIIAHELIHIHYAGAERIVESLDGVLGSQAYEIVDSIYTIETERGADSMSRLVARLQPMPE